MILQSVAASVQAGRRVKFEAKGHSMEPLVKNNEIVTVRPLDRPLSVGDVVLARVRGHWYLHRVTALRQGQAQIGNNHGGINGWTSTKNVIGLLER